MIKLYRKKSRLGYYNVGYQLSGGDKLHMRKFRSEKDAINWEKERKKLHKL